MTEPIQSPAHPAATAADLVLHDIVWTVPGRRILDGVSLRVAPGAFVGLVGPNGGGKSSLLRCAYRVHRPQSGSVLLDGIDLWKIAPRTAARRIAAVLQETPSGFGLTVRQMAALGRTPHLAGMADESAQDQRIVADALALVDLADAADRSFDLLSGGEKQRVLFARALVQQPRLLILDEPTNHLDIRHQRDLLRLVRGLGVSVLASLHDLNQAAAYCDRIHVLDAGRIVAAGTPAEIFTPASIARTFGLEATVDTRPDGRVSLRYEA
ncbi:MAG TPA: ABC transporter ATP-binding protein [Aliidongia sp.]|uniref:ABC transporter ATP-binding protein n=1 Tax=Aliidongia sp. TaxID=1914230 RepID=UPI002DDCF0C0|nr:ABC transporter ATP-binding protein [Aliidongia sp.]HEV2678429.1 ABC transporter ATP-binding protein [Aliidongia sp.]